MRRTYHDPEDPEDHAVNGGFPGGIGWGLHHPGTPSLYNETKSSLYFILQCLDYTSLSTNHPNNKCY